MSQSDLDPSVEAPPPSCLTGTDAILPPPRDPTRLLTSRQVWLSLSAGQQAGVRQAVIALCCQMAGAASVAERRAARNLEAGDEQG